MVSYRLSATAQADVVDILAWGHVDTGAGVVRRPRHFLIYRVEPALFVLGRVLHDAMELARHLDPETS